MRRAHTLQGFRYFWNPDPTAAFEIPFAAPERCWDAFDWLVEPQVDAFCSRGVFT